MTLLRQVALRPLQLISSPMRTGTPSLSLMILLSLGCQHLLHSPMKSSLSASQLTLMLVMILLVYRSHLLAGAAHLTLLLASQKYFVKLM